MRWQWIGVFVIFISVSLSGQSDKSSLEKQRAKLIEEIELTSKLVSQAKSKSKATLSDLQLVEAQLKRRKALVDVLESELKDVKRQAASLQDSIQILEGLIESGKKEYALMLNRAHIKERTAHPFQYLANGVAIFEGFQKWIYMRQLKQFILRKFESLTSQVQDLEAKSAELEQIVEKKTQLVADARAERETVSKETDEKRQLLKKIKGNMNDLQSRLTKQKAERKKLNDAIEKLILAELERNRREREAGGLSPEAFAALSSDFEKNQGRLPWPVGKSVITSAFGRQSHPDIKGVYMDNTGIDILADAASPVKVIFDGTVVGSTKIAGHQNMIVVNHGEYYTVYSKLVSVNAKAGDKLSTGDVLGQTGRAVDGLGNLHFEIWKEKNKVDPQKWIVRK